MGKEKLTQKQLKEILHYEKSTGVFTWLSSVSGSVKSGGLAGTFNDKGYVMIGIMYSIYGAHRLAFLYVKGYLPEYCVDHIDRDPGNNRWSNLREASRSCNLRNCNTSKNNTSGVSGVSWEAKYRKWKAQINSNGKQIYLGSFKTILSAAKARHTAEIKYDYPNCSTTSSAKEYIESHECL